MFDRLIRTTDSPAALILRVTLGLVMLPHGLQKMFGLFGGFGWDGTLQFFNSLGIPTALGAAGIVVEVVAPLALILGAFSRAAALGVLGLMVGAAVLVHAPFGFWMNWTGAQAGEGYEYHLLAMAMSAAVMIMGGGLASVDRMLARR